VNKSALRECLAPDHVDFEPKSPLFVIAPYMFTPPISDYVNVVVHELHSGNTEGIGEKEVEQMRAKINNVKPSFVLSCFMPSQLVYDDVAIFFWFFRRA
jgi:hypothetical protein